MADLSGAVDLSEVAKTLGPRESEALQAELRMMAQTRELALRRQVELEAENEGISRVASALLHVLGHDGEDGCRQYLLSAEDMADAAERTVSFEMLPIQGYLRLVNTYRYPGTWKITDRRPTESEQGSLPIYEDLPTVVTRPGPMTAILATKKGGRIAEWQPA